MSDSSIVSSAAARNVCILRYGSLALLGGYVVATCYKIGLVRRILPAKWNHSLESTVEVIKQRTQPIGDAKRFALVRAHLTCTYGLAASGMLAVAAGVAAFWAVPSIPFAIPIAATLVSTVLLLGVPKAYMHPAARLLCFYLSLYSTGYTFGPIGWVAQDTLVVFVLLSGCTMTGLCVPLYLTRGMISYVVSAQVLSSALSVALITAPKQSRDTSVFKKLKEQAGVQIVLNGDVNVLFTMQLLSNVGICALHTLPNIFRFVIWQGDEEELTDSADPLKEAFAICAGTMYVLYRAVRWSCRLLIRRVMSDSQQSPRGGAGQNTWLAMSSHSLDVNDASGVVSGLVMGLWYVRAVSLLQKGDVEATLNHLRTVCARISPVALLLGSSSAGR
ncbi:putative mitochondrial hypothetical protein [Leptomonas pyrrhocoris]|uniref:Uncharacterized protein n=1 Tax=Leptomonas pyrrhocoris TaxID=157538 RepID=A0A0N0VFF5_LEPPY|nr:putative mitochondrial hypothetical protein [Leptomonas pyrrhocoris]XP_015659497.1 putative mitochondrial hypothetical protein [Leptomonas pyrrhocoris]KPA81057.1 putative mitochondrial hypothetical protein [Leptomonas pyrrhocoris]KPA81058.1 putative mitochondrial hypothetical protein [Leptomonas pyrrhocoris]|eukprot:XP_015659496.1 putative mitochondrial hypothetical protein [Leptomonas pyrrhocoris]